SLTDEEAIYRIGEKWNIAITKAFRPVDVNEKLRLGEIKALLIFGEDPLLDTNNGKYFRNVEFLLTSSPFASVTMQNADVILPASSFIENEGTYTRFDNTLQHAPQIIQTSHRLANWELIQKLGEYFIPGPKYNTIEELQEEIYTLLSPGKESTSEKRNNPLNNYPLYSFTLLDSNLSSSNAIKPSLHYQENYYFSHIKMQIS
ncbi:MAG: molybdopterin-dependent oxidoreductase, partial [Ignavibacteriales bacterium]|nr:molybdopterin-dependent oxidoreductase [Ignavibacteriales bacterium]